MFWRNTVHSRISLKNPTNYTDTICCIVGWKGISLLWHQLLPLVWLDVKVYKQLAVVWHHHFWNQDENVTRDIQRNTGITIQTAQNFWLVSNKCSELILSRRLVFSGQNIDRYASEPKDQKEKWVCVPAQICLFGYWLMLASSFRNIVLPNLMQENLITIRWFANKAFLQQSFNHNIKNLVKVLF